MDTQHTPGPWIRDWNYITGAKGESVISISTGAVYGEYSSDPPEMEISPANEALILAAPDLLAACRAALPWIDASSEMPPERRVALDALEAAIAKAEGR